MDQIYLIVVSRVFDLSGFVARNLSGCPIDIGSLTLLSTNHTMSYVPADFSIAPTPAPVVAAILEPVVTTMVSSIIVPPPSVPFNPPTPPLLMQAPVAAPPAVQAPVVNPPIDTAAPASTPADAAAPAVAPVAAAPLPVCK